MPRRATAPPPIIVLAVLGLLVAACELLPLPTPPASPPIGGVGVEARKMAEAQARWEASGIRDYTMTVAIACECGGGPFKVVVRDRTLVSIDGQPAGPAGPFRALTVDELYVAARDALRQGGIWGDYDDRGVPTKLLVDPIPNAIDDEREFQISDFVAG